jgi:hypothetical protein
MESGRLQVGVPDEGTGEGRPSLQGPPVDGAAMPTDMKKAAVLAACPPSFRDANPESLFRNDAVSMWPRRDESQGFHARPSTIANASSTLVATPAKPPTLRTWPRNSRCSVVRFDRC